MVKAEIRRRRCLPIPEQGKWRASVVRGHQAYYAVPGNSDAVSTFRAQVTRHWLKTLRRRSQKSRLTWARMNRIATRWLPPARWHTELGEQLATRAGRPRLVSDQASAR
jgi:hypothetical protein